MITRKIFLITAFFAIGFAPTMGNAQGKQESLGTFKDWATYSFTENGKKSCYMATKPKSSKGNYTRRGDVYFFVTHRPGEKSTNVSSFEAGYPFANNYRVKAVVNSRSGSSAYEMLTRGETAWAQTKDDQAFVQAMIKGSEMVIAGRSARGTDTVDTFSLSGFTKAHETISSACGVR